MQPDIASTEAMLERNLRVLRYVASEARRRGIERRSIIGLIKRIWPWFIVEEVHLVMAGFLEAFRDGLMPLSMLWVAPRASKSMTASVAMPAGYLGENPGKRVMLCSHTHSLAQDFSRAVKDVVGMPEYREVYPNIAIRPDIHAAGRWDTLKHGGMTAAGVATGIAGKGFHRGLIDDPLNEQTAQSELENEKVNKWYPLGFYNRRDPTDNAINITQTRWRKDDLSGFLAGQARTDKSVDQPQILRIPALIDEATAELLNEQAGHPLLSPRPDGSRKPYRFKAAPKGADADRLLTEENSFAPRRFPIRELLRAKSMPGWDHLYQQNPSAAEGAIYKRRSWRMWQEPKAPVCFEIIQVYDTNFEEEDRKKNSYCARTTWGLFEWDGDGVPRTCAVLLEAWRGRPGFPDLMVMAESMYREFDADLLIIEKKASGHAMLQECRRRAIRSLAFLPLTKSKTARASHASVVHSNGNIWYMNRSWAKDVIDECTDFPNGEYDDWVDTVTIVCLYMRKKYLLSYQEAEDVREREALEAHFGEQQPAQLA